MKSIGFKDFKYDMDMDMEDMDMDMEDMDMDMEDMDDMDMECDVFYIFNCTLLYSMSW